MNTPGLPSHFFSFPLDNITYPVAIDPFSESNRLTKVVEEYPPEVEMIRYAPKSKFVGVNADGSFNKTYPGTTGDPVFRFVVKGFIPSEADG